MESNLLGDHASVLLHEAHAAAPVILGAHGPVPGASAAVAAATIARVGAGTSAAVGVPGGPVTLTCSAKAPTGVGAARGLRVAVRPAGLVVAPVLVATIASRPPCQVAARRQVGTAKGSAVRVPIGQTVRSRRPVPVVPTHATSRAATALQGAARDGASSARRRVGRTALANAVETPGVVEAGIAAVPHLDVPATAPTGSALA